MANPKISTITLPSGTTYDIKDASYAGGNAWYGTCSTAAGTAAKSVTTETGDFTLDTGCIVFVKFTNGNTSTSATLSVDSSTAKSIKQYGTTAPVTTGWAANAIVGFIYDGTNFVQIDGSTATTSIYGITKLSSSTSSTSEVLAATPKAVKDALDAAKSYTDTAVTGAVMFQGTINSNSAISGLSDYKRGWYWVVATAGTYVGETCEIGDFIFCISDRASAYSANDFSVVQANIDMSIFGDLAYKDTASATYTPAGTVSQPTFTGTQGSVSVTTSGAVTAVTVNTTSSGGTDITPSGTIGDSAGTANYTPAGTVAITQGTDTTASVTGIASVGTLPSASWAVSGETATFSFDAGTLPAADASATTVITARGADTAAFTGTAATITVE